jgi:hypothetical protein
MDCRGSAGGAEDATVVDGATPDGAAGEELLEREELSIEPTIADRRAGASAADRMVVGGGGAALDVGAAGAEAPETVAAGTVTGAGIRATLAVFVAANEETESAT